MKFSKVLIAIPVAFILYCVGLYAYCQLNKAYWDREVRKLCEIDGGVQIYEKVELSVGEYPDLINDRGILRIPFKSHAKKDDPFFRESNTDILRSRSPKVYRYEQSIVRSKDNKTLSVQVGYVRQDGDFPVGIGPASSFSCGNSSDDMAPLTTVITRKGI